MASLLFNDDGVLDVILILTFIDKYTINLGITDVVLDVALIERVVSTSKADFPHDGGLGKASAFKQAANFACFFVAERPILEPFPVDAIGPELAKIANHQNAMVAFALAEASLHKSKIQRKDKEVVVSNPMKYSKHSYIDIIDALASITPSSHFKLVSVLLEQLVYKTNPECQYPTI